MERRTRFSLLYYLWVLSLILLVDTFLFGGPSVPEIPYSEFLDRVTKNQVATVVLTPEQIWGEMKATSGAAPTDVAKTSDATKASDAATASADAAHAPTSDA